MIIGAHIMLHSTNDKADMAVLNELNLQSINAGGGYMIYALPPAEMSVHASDHDEDHKLYLMCDDIAAFTAEMTRHHIPFSTPVRQSWGTATEITLPGGGGLGVYQPRHERPELATAKQPKRKKVDGGAKKSAKAAVKKSTPKKPAKSGLKRKIADRKRSARR